MVRRQKIRLVISGLSAFFLAAVIGPVIGQYFIELAQEHGLYQRPSERLITVMSAAAFMMAQTWVLVLAAFLGGITLGLWIDYLLRRLERATLPYAENGNNQPARAVTGPNHSQSQTSLSPSTQAYTRSRGRIRHNMHMYGGSLLAGPKGKQFPLRFSTANSESVHVYRGQLIYLARIRGKQKGERLRVSELPNSPVFTLKTEERFIARNGSGDMLQGRLAEIKDDRSGHEYNEVIFDYLISEDLPEFTAI